MVLWSHVEVQVYVSLHLHAQGPSYPFSCACCRQNCKEQVVFSSPPTINCIYSLFYNCLHLMYSTLGSGARKQGGTSAHSWAMQLVFDWCGHSLVPHHVEIGRSLSDRCECVVTCLGLFFCCKDLTWFPHIYRVFGIGWSFRFCLVSIELWSPEKWTIVI